MFTGLKLTLKHIYRLPIEIRKFLCHISSSKTIKVETEFLNLACPEIFTLIS